MEADVLRLLSVGSLGGNGYEYRFAVGRRLRRYVTEVPLRLEYDRPLRDLPPAVAAIPFAAVFSPLVWSVGGCLELPELESVYAGSLEKIRTGYRGMFPEIAFAGEVRIGRTVPVPFPGPEKTAMLFSGGVDSLNTALRRQPEDPLLISVFGSDVRLRQTRLREKVEADQAAAASVLGLRRATVACNFFDILRAWSLDLRFMDPLPRSWYADISHGQILLGLCAPLAWQEGVRTLYIASSFPEVEEQRGGSSQALDEATAWGGTRVVHDGTTESRQDKVERLAGAVAGLPELPPVRVCYAGAAGSNCGACEKCCRTIAGLLLAGTDPARMGLPVSADTPALIRRSLEGNLWQLPFPYFWRDLQRRTEGRAGQLPPDWEAFFQWLREADLGRFIRQRPRSRQENLKRWSRRRLPFVLYERLRRWKRKLAGPRFDY